jgi:hypothetical protein
VISGAVEWFFLEVINEVAQRGGGVQEVRFQFKVVPLIFKSDLGQVNNQSFNLHGDEGVSIVIFHVERHVVQTLKLIKRNMLAAVIMSLFGGRIRLY